MLDKIKKELKRLEIIVENIKNYVEIEQNKRIEDIFVVNNSSLEKFLPIFKELDVKIREIDDGVGFRTTKSGLVYEINDQVFTTIYPQVNALKIEYATPDGWKNCKTAIEGEIYNVRGERVLIDEVIKESCNYIKKKNPHKLHDLF